MSRGAESVQRLDTRRLCQCGEQRWTGSLLLLQREIQVEQQACDKTLHQPIRDQND